MHPSIHTKAVRRILPPSSLQHCNHTMSCNRDRIRRRGGWLNLGGFGGVEGGRGGGGPRRRGENPPSTRQIETQTQRDAKKKKKKKKKKPYMLFPPRLQLAERHSRLDDGFFGPRRQHAPLLRRLPLPLPAATPPLSESLHTTKPARLARAW